MPLLVEIRKIEYFGKCQMNFKPSKASLLACVTIHENSFTIFFSKTLLIKNKFFDQID
jgi:hypothetical protein